MKEIRVLKNRIMIGAAAAAAAIVPVAGVSALAATPAGAATPKGITCSKISGTAQTTGTAKLKFTTCTGNTGASGKSKGAEGDTSAKITWANAKSTSFTENLGTGTNCPSTAVADELLTGTVTADTTKSTAIGAAVSGEICATVTSTGAIKLSNAPGTKFIIAP
jgi:hypothetical protein